MQINDTLTVPIEFTKSEAEFLNSARLYYEKKANRKNTYANFIKICTLKTANDIFQQSFNLKDLQPYIMKATNVNKVYFSTIPGRQGMQRLELKEFITKFKEKTVYDVESIINYVKSYYKREA